MRSWGGLLAIAACTATSPARRLERLDIIAEALPAQERFAPPTPAVDTYADLVAIAPRDPLDAQVFAMLQRFSVAERPMHLDAALSAACAELARAEPDERGFGAGLVEHALARHGVVEPSPKLVVVHGDPTRPEELAERIRAQFVERDFHAAALRIGIGVGARRDGVAPVVVAVLGTRISIAPIRRVARTGERLTIDAKLTAQLRDPQLVVVREDGTIARTPLAGPTAIACGEVPGELRVEITASQSTGPATVASFPLWCGVTPPLAYRWERAAIQDGVETPAEIERRLVALVNRDRRAAGVAPLALDAEAAATARAHVHEGRVPALHGSAYSAVEASDLRAAYEALANATAGREHLLAASSTRIGVAVARRDGRLRATLIYRRVPPPIDTDAAAREVTTRITAWTGVEAYPPLVAIAQRFADEVVAGTPQPEAWQDMRWWLQDIRWRFAHFNYGIAYVPTISLTTRDALLGPGVIDAFGVAVRQADHPRFGPRTIWIVVVYGERK